VFPLAHRSKFPLISAANGGHGLHDATTDAARIQAWWMAHPTANIGLRTGVAFDVIDLDNEPAVDALESARAGREQISGPVVATAKGFHYFVLPTGLGNRAGVLPGIDFRGRDGYVVGAPSVHPSGVRYRWIIHDQLGPAPSWLVDLIGPQREPALNGSKELRVSNSSAYGRAALRRELERVSAAQPGTRNDQFNRSAFALGQLVAIGALDEDETAATLIAEGQLLGLGVLECERTVASGLAAGMEQPRSLAL
jgi:Bifunctional DNA primase/polymerase, N-terminal